jgi:hypothetical protein
LASLKLTNQLTLGNENMSVIDKIKTFNLTDLHAYAQIMLHSSCEDVIGIEEITEGIRDNLLSWVKSGILLDVVKKEFRFLVLRSKVAGTWQEYCAKFFNKTHWYADKIISASKVVLLLVKRGFNVLPTCELQARPLTRLLPDPEQMNSEEIEILEQDICDHWQKVIDTASATNKGVITGNIVKSIVDPDSVENAKNSIKVDSDTFEKLSIQALELGFNNVTDYLKAIANNETLENEPSIDPIEYEEKIKLWEEDLEQLVKEHEEKEAKQQTKKASSNMLDACENLIKQVDDQFSKFWQLDIFGGRQVHNSSSA